MKQYLYYFIEIVTVIVFILTFNYQDTIISRHKEVLDKLFGVDKKTFWKYNARIWRLAFYAPGLILPKSFGSDYFPPEKLKLLNKNLLNDIRKLVFWMGITLLMMIVFSFVTK